MFEKKIFLFWQGAENEKLIKKIKFIEENSGFKVILGPTTKEHEYLLENFKYYRISKKNKNYAFMSDLWRAYITTKHSGIYIDAQTLLGKEFFKFSTAMFKKKNDVLMMENSDRLCNGFFRFNKNSSFFKWILRYYEEFNNLKTNDPYDLEIQPHVFLVALIKMGYSKKINCISRTIRLKSTEIELIESIFFTFLKGNNVMSRNGSGSWTSFKPSTEQEHYNAFIQKKSFFKRLYYKIYIQRPGLIIFVNYFILFKSSKAKQKIRQLKNRKLIIKKIDL